MRLIFGFFVLTALSSYGQVRQKYDNSIQNLAEKMMAESDFRNASISFYVLDIDSNKVIADLDGARSMVPASTMKIVTTATALEELGSYYKFKTYLEYDGTIDSASKTLNGNIYIKGGGDPSLGSRFFSKKINLFKKEWFDAIRKLGIDSITGSIIGDATWFKDDMIPTTWIWGDIGNYYGAGPSGLSIYDNTFYLDFTSGPKSGDPTEITCIRPYVPGLNVDNRVVSANIRNDQAYIFGAPYNQNRIIQGRIPKNKENFEVKGAMPDPAYQAAWELSWLLIDSGLVVNGVPTTVRRSRAKGQEFEAKRIRFHEHRSPSLSQIIYWTNMLSINLYAEHLLRALAKRKYKDGSNFSGTVAIGKHWEAKGINTIGLHVNDGSGLSRYNAISAEHLTRILASMDSSKYSKSFKSSLPIAGRSGTLKNMCKGTSAEGNLRAKSGTMSRVKSYAGYVTTKSKRRLAFSVIINNHSCTGQELKKKLERLMVTMASYPK
ncbi:D-alanyl-D-alanine carboxypeptidase/D-alanyl-D-alanine-endopeptidase [Flavobacteriales bacterium]|nr:D-alanyl-D-alanine carboxypeptidase/D-alanyl-D-alanine-endopeptidase [Flavobacteriales bacterium]